MKLHDKNALAALPLALMLALAGAPAGSAQAGETAGVAVDARAALVDEVTKIAGWDDTFAKLERILRDRALSDSRTPHMSRPAYNIFGTFVRDHLNQKVLKADAEAQLKTELASLSDAQLRAYIDAMKQPLPQQMLAYDRTALDRNELALINRYKINLQFKAPPKERLALIDRYLAASGLRDAYMQDQLAQLRQLLVAAQPTLPESELKSQMDTLKPELEKKVTFGTRADALALYRKVSDADLESYVKLLESPAISDVLTRVVRVSVEANQRATLAMLDKLAEAAPPTPQEVEALKAEQEAARNPSR